VPYTESKNILGEFQSEIPVYSSGPDRI